MAVTFDAVGPSSAGSTTESPTPTASWSHTCSGLDRLLVVGLALGHNDTSRFTVAVTYAGVPMRPVAKIASNNDVAGFAQLFALANPAAGANTVLVTPSDTADALSCGSVSFNGVDQATPVITAVSAAGTGTTPSVIVPATVAGNMIVDALADGGAITSSNKTQRWLRNTNTHTAAGNGAGSTAAAGGDITMSYAAVDDWFGIVAVELRAADSPTGSGSQILSRRKPNELPS